MPALTPEVASQLLKDYGKSLQVVEEMLQRLKVDPIIKFYTLNTRLALLAIAANEPLIFGKENFESESKIGGLVNWYQDDDGNLHPIEKHITPISCLKRIMEKHHSIHKYSPDFLLIIKFLLMMDDHSSNSDELRKLEACILYITQSLKEHHAQEVPPQEETVCSSNMPKALRKEIKIIKIIVSEESHIPDQAALPNLVPNSDEPQIQENKNKEKSHKHKKGKHKHKKYKFFFEKSEKYLKRELESIKEEDLDELGRVVDENEREQDIDDGIGVLCSMV